MSENEEKLFDVIVPPGVPRSILIDISEKFDVEIVSRKQPLSYANMDGDIRELLAFRCKKDVADQVYDYMMSELKKFIGEEEN